MRIESFLPQSFQKDESLDLQIRYRGQQIWKSLTNRTALTANDIIDLQKEYSFDTALSVLYNHFKERDTYKELETFWSYKKPIYQESNKDRLVVILTHNPWMKRHENMDMQRQLRNLAIAAGYEVCCPNIEYRRSMYHNAYKYQEILKRHKGRQALFVTNSLASLELRWYMEKTLELAVEPIGWLNVAGLLFGTSLTSRLDWISRFKKKALGEYLVPPSLSRSQSYCYRALDRDSMNLPMISVLPFQPRLIKEGLDEIEHELDPWGPHDQTLSLCDYISVKHTVWPIWGAGHDINMQLMPTRFQQCLNYLSNEDGRGLEL